MLHCGIFSALWPSTIVNFAIKLATTCPFMVVHSQYYISNSFNSTTHNAIRPAASKLLITLRKGLSIRTTIVCAWKYNLSFRATVTNAKESFSFGGYFFPTPRSTQLMKYTSFYTRLFSNQSRANSSQKDN